LYVKANGEVPCWDDVGENLVLTTVQPKILLRGQKPSLFHSPELQRIRQAFLQGHYPHPSLCERCAVLDQGSTRPDPAATAQGPPPHTPASFSRRIFCE